MSTKTKIRNIISYSLSRHGMLVISAAALLVVLVLAVTGYHFKAPNVLVMTTGFESGAYASYGERYRDILAREHIQLKLISSSGSRENLARLQDKSFRVDAGFVQDGMSRPAEAGGNLVSLGAIGYSPLWVFYRSGETLNYFAELKGKRIAIGPEGSGAHQYAVELLKLNQCLPPSTVLFNLTGPAAGKALLEGKIDAVVIIGAEDNAIVKELLYSPDVRLMTFRQAEAYTRLIPALSHVVLPQGILDVPRKVPSQDVHLLAVTTSLIVRKDLHPALIYLLLDAAVEIHGNAGWVNKKGEFPSPKELSFPSSNYAERFYKSGRPFLLDYLPFGLAAFIDRTILIMFPAILILIPLIRGIPLINAWRHRQKFYQWYRELKNLELEMTGGSGREDLSGYLEKIDRIEVSINKIQVPPAFFKDVYRLQEHIDYVRGKLLKISIPLKGDS